MHCLVGFVEKYSFFVAHWNWNHHHSLRDAAVVAFSVIIQIVSIINFGKDQRTYLFMTVRHLNKEMFIVMIDEMQSIIGKKKACNSILPIDISKKTSLLFSKIYMLYLRLGKFLYSVLWKSKNISIRLINLWYFSIFDTVLSLQIEVA